MKRIANVLTVAIATVCTLAWGCSSATIAESPESISLSIEKLDSIHNMGTLLEAQRRYAEAEVYYVEAFEGRGRLLGTDHSITLTSESSLGTLLSSQNRHAEAEPYLREVHEKRRRRLGEQHPATAASFNDLASVLEARGDYAALATLYEAWGKPEEAANWREKLKSKE